MAKKITTILVFLLFPLSAIAAEMGDYYLQKELYFEAVTEYKRALFFDQSGDRDQYLYKIADACYRGGQKQLAEEPLVDAVTNAETSPYDRKCMKLLALIHWDHYDYNAMRGVLGMLATHVDSSRQDQINYISAWSYIYQADWESGIERLQTVKFTNVDDLITDIEHAENIPQKSRWLASLMSNIIPGAGQLYAGDHQNALYSFLLVGSVEASIIWNIVEKAYFIAATKYMFLFSRYSQGGLKNLARKIDVDNVNRIGDYLKEVSEKYPDPITILRQL
ncbi:MAG: tetratricopeptide repeat protein [Fidelibacterota bacterium]